uniref:LO4 n=1 Tax=Blueface angelfish adomavirus TaxID=2609871 RepID=A0A6F9F7Q2_9VIRU|nr:TPA_asm: LO4 [Blueface angelfish adomavirus]
METIMQPLVLTWCGCGPPHWVLASSLIAASGSTARPSSPIPFCEHPVPEPIPNPEPSPSPNPNPNPDPVPNPYPLPNAEPLPDIVPKCEKNDTLNDCNVEKPAKKPRCA